MPCHDDQDAMMIRTKITLSRFLSDWTIADGWRRRLPAVAFGVACVDCDDLPKGARAAGDHTRAAAALPFIANVASKVEKKEREI